MGEEQQKPFTRTDIENKIKEHGGSQGLDLSEKVFEEAIDLSGLDIRGIILKGARFPTRFEGSQLVGAKFNGSELTAADLRNINFQYAQFTKLGNQTTCLAVADLRGSSFLNANFQSADLTGAKFGDVLGESYAAAMPDFTDFRGAKLFRANFNSCYFYGTKLEGAFIRGADILKANLEHTDWGNFVLGEEKNGDFNSASYYYRQLKIWYTNAGMYDIAGKFFFREMTANRKTLRWWPNPIPRAWHKFLSVICGYGERWERVVFSAVAVILVLTLIYFIFNSVWEWYAFWRSLYFSMVSFTAVGYGGWVNEKWFDGYNDVIIGLGVTESLIGVFMMALFLVTFTRKMTR